MGGIDEQALCAALEAAGVAFLEDVTGEILITVPGEVDYLVVDLDAGTVHLGGRVIEVEGDVAEGVVALVLRARSPSGAPAAPAARAASAAGRDPHDRQTIDLEELIAERQAASAAGRPAAGNDSDDGTQPAVVDEPIAGWAPDIARAVVELVTDRVTPDDVAGALAAVLAERPLYRLGRRRAMAGGWRPGQNAPVPLGPIDDEAEDADEEPRTGLDQIRAALPGPLLRLFTRAVSHPLPLLSPRDARGRQDMPDREVVVEVLGQAGWINARALVELGRPVLELVDGAIAVIDDLPGELRRDMPARVSNTARPSPRAARPRRPRQPGRQAPAAGKPGDDLAALRALEPMGQLRQGRVPRSDEQDGRAPLAWRVKMGLAVGPVSAVAGVTWEVALPDVDARPGTIAYLWRWCAWRPLGVTRARIEVHPDHAIGGWRVTAWCLAGACGGAFAWHATIGRTEAMQRVRAFIFGVAALGAPPPFDDERLQAELQGAPFSVAGRGEALWIQLRGRYLHFARAEAAMMFGLPPALPAPRQREARRCARPVVASLPPIALPAPEPLRPRSSPTLDRWVRYAQTQADADVRRGLIDELRAGHELDVRGAELVVDDAVRVLQGPGLALKAWPCAAREPRVCISSVSSGFEAAAAVQLVLGGVERSAASAAPPTPHPVVTPITDATPRRRLRRATGAAERHSEQPVPALFSRYGSQDRATSRLPPPEHETIVEALAGGAAYARRYPDRAVVLVDADPTVVEVWRYLISADPAEILALPDLPSGGSVDEMELPCDGARYLVGFWIRRGCERPRRTASRWAMSGQWPRQFWGATVRARIAAAIPRIRHWQVMQGDFAAAPIEGPATWVVDPPWQGGGGAGRRYRFQVDDYGRLAEWVTSREGQVIVLEGEGADWLPFVPLQGASTSTLTGRRKTPVVWWYRGATGSAGDQPPPRVVQPPPEPPLISDAPPGPARDLLRAWLALAPDTGRRPAVPREKLLELRGRLLREGRPAHDQALARAAREVFETPVSREAIWRAHDTARSRLDQIATEIGEEVVCAGLDALGWAPRWGQWA